MSLSPANEKEIKEYLLNSTTAMIIRQFHVWQNMREGDVLIRQRRYMRGPQVNWSVEEVSDRCRVPRKFKIVKIDHLGLPWVKQISVRGGMGQKLHCLVDGVSQYRYEQDPEISMAILLGVSYDPREQYKRWRQNNPTYSGNAQD